MEQEEVTTPANELDSIKAIEKQVEDFAKILGDAAKEEDLKAIKSEISALKEGLDTLTGAEVLKQIEKINAANQKLHEQIVKMQESEAEKKEKEEGAQKKTKGLFSPEEVEKFCKTIFPEGKDTPEKIRKHTRIEVKAPEQFGYPQTFVDTADVTAFTGRRIEPELNFRRRKTNIILDYFNIRTIDVPSLIYLRKIEVGTGESPEDLNVGGAAWIACGTPKPLRSFRLGTGTAEAKKIAIFNTIDDCLLQDVPSFMNWVREDFLDELREGINDGLLNNDPDVNDLAPLGLKTNAILYTPTPAFDENIPSPTYIDAITAIAALLATLRERASVVFVAWDVYYAIQILKDNDARYQNSNLVYRSADGRLYISGVEVVGVDEEDVPSTHVLAIGAEVGFRIYRYGDMVIETGLNGQDFREDKTSIRGYQRFLSYIAEERENSVLYDEWDNILTAIEAPVDSGTD